MQRVFRKLGNNSGESIAELLIAILVSVLGITLLAIMIQTSARLIFSSTAKIQEYTLNENKIVQKTEEPVVTANVVLFENESNTISLYKDCGQLEVKVFEMEYGNRKIIAFEK